MRIPVRKSRYLFLLLAIIPLCFLSCRQEQPLTPVEQWQAKILEAHGGRDALTRIKTLIFNGRIATDKDRGTVVLALSRGRKLRTTMKYSKRAEDRILKGTRGWRDFGSGYEEASGASLDAMVFQYNHLDLPMAFIDGNYKISFFEKKIGDTIFPTLELTGAEGPVMNVMIDSETGLIQLVEGRISAGGRQVIMAVGYGDYREVAGVMLPYRIVNYVNGNDIAESRFDFVGVNRELDENYFAIEDQEVGK